MDSHGIEVVRASLKRAVPKVQKLNSEGCAYRVQLQEPLRMRQSRSNMVFARFLVEKVQLQHMQPKHP